MPMYTLSSTDPKHYNRVQVNLPLESCAGFVQVCVTSLTCNCNIQVMGADDFITFSIDGNQKTVYMEDNSKLTTASLPYIMQDLFDNQGLEVNVTVTGLDTLKFTSKHEFSILNMSYNMKLITGFYNFKDEEYPITSVEYEEDVSLTDKVNKDATSYSLRNMNIKVGDERPLVATITPPDAYGYNVQYKSSDEEVAIIQNGNVVGLKEGTVTITGSLRNPNTLLTSDADFTSTCTIQIAEGKSVKIDSITLDKDLTLFVGESKTLYPTFNPFHCTGYVDQWVSTDPAIATVTNGSIMGLKVGSTTVSYIVTNNLSDEQQNFNVDVNVIIKSPTEKVKMQKIECASVGYCLSTPILYLLTNIGSPVYFNEMTNENKMQNGVIAMVLNNSYSSSFPIVAQQNSITTQCTLSTCSNFWLYLVDANMREVKLLNPMYITVEVAMVQDQSMQSI